MAAGTGVLVMKMATSGLSISMTRWKRQHWFVVSAVLVFAILFLKMKPVSVAPYIKGTVSLNSAPILSIDQPRATTNTRMIFVDTLDFPDSRGFSHRRIGPMVFGENYFIDFEGTFTVPEGQVFTFSVESDDGFRMSIDGKMVSQFESPRAVGTSQGSALLTKGRHTLHLSYFQALGNAALVVHYSVRGQSGSYVLGKISPFMAFDEFPELVS